jgi:hypothetical protein
MNAVNEKPLDLHLRAMMVSDTGWGREQGRIVYQKLIQFVEGHPSTYVFRICLNEVMRTDISFASETGIELARRYRGKKGFCILDPQDLDMLENWEAAAERKAQPLMVWTHRNPRVIGLQPSAGNAGALAFALERGSTRASEYARATEGMSIANASTKFKQLWEQGFLLRREDFADSGGMEFSYSRIGG